MRQQPRPNFEESTVENSGLGAKKLCGVWVQDLNGNQVEVFSKDKSFERVAMAGGLRGERCQRRGLLY